MSVDQPLVEGPPLEANETVVPDGSSEASLAGQRAFHSNFSETPALGSLWDRSAEDAGSYSEARGHFWTAVNDPSNQDPDAVAVRGMLSEAGYNLGTGSQAPMLAMDGWDEDGTIRSFAEGREDAVRSLHPDWNDDEVAAAVESSTREVAQRQLTIDHAVPQSVAREMGLDELNVDPENLRFMSNWDNLVRGANFDATDQPYGDWPHNK